MKPKKNSENNENNSITTPRILPPALFLLSTLLILAFGYIETGTLGTSYLGLPLSVLALAIASREKKRFEEVGTTIFPGQDASQLVTAGAFKFSRNPMYLAMVVALLGVWPVTGGLSPIAVVLAFVAIIHFKFILPEENHMRSLFGDDYEAYSKRVRRWL